MRISTLVLNCCLLLSAAFIAGCGKSNSPAGQPAMPETQKALGTAADETKKALADAASTVTQNAKSTASDIASQFLNMAKTQKDNVLNSIGQDLGLKAKSLSDTCGSNDNVKTNLDHAMTAMLQGQDTQALAPAFQVAQGVNLTPTQLQLAKEVGNLASAFVVQRNFASLPGAQGDVATLVSSLRGGQYAAALPPLQKILNNASLTSAQKDLIGSIADKYAPSLKQAAGSLQQGLDTLKGLPGLKK